jgi:hypothetical protein
VENPYQPPTAAEPPLLPPSRADLRNPRLLAVSSLWLYGISSAAEVVDHLQRSLAPPLPDLGDPAFHDTYYVTSAGLTPLDGVMLLAGLGSLILYLMWKYRAAANARILDPAAARISPGMAVGSYFIPFVQLVIPCQAMAGIARASKVGLAGVALWWAGHMGILVGVVVFAMMPATTDWSGPPTVFEHVFLIWSLLTFLFSWQIVMRITRAQSAARAIGGIASV